MAGMIAASVGISILSELRAHLLLAGVWINVRYVCRLRAACTLTDSC